jgi:peptidoglycan/xylan/chitin deacetylase (PgdA/CDA1 family)
MKALVKPPFERMLAARWIGSVTKQRVRNKRLVLAYHGIIPDDAPLAGEQSLFIRRAEFAAQLDLINSVADVAPLHRLDEQGDGRPRVAISFDDAYYGAVSDGIDELVQRKLPVTIFVAPGRLGGSVFWWDALADHTGYLDERTRTYALETLNGAHEKVRSWAKANEMHWTEDLPAYAKTTTLDYLREAVKRPGVTVGSHSWSHRNLATLTAVDVLTELHRSRAMLRSHFGAKCIGWLAYPYGRDSAASQQIVAGASYTGALRVDGGWYDAATSSVFSRPRLNVPAGLSVARLKAHLMGTLLS